MGINHLLVDLAIANERRYDSLREAERDRRVAQAERGRRTGTDPRGALRRRMAAIGSARLRSAFRFAVWPWAHADVRPGGSGDAD